MTEIKIRKIKLSDAMEIQKISQEDLGYECSLSLVENKINSLDKNHEQVFVACRDGAVAGFIHVEKYDTLYFETMCNVLGLAVKKDFQKTGIGKALVTAAENWAKENGIKFMSISRAIMFAHESMS